MSKPWRYPDRPRVVIEGNLWETEVEDDDQLRVVLYVSKDEFLRAAREAYQK